MLCNKEKCNSSCQATAGTRSSCRLKRMRLHGFIIPIEVYKETREKDERNHIPNLQHTLLRGEGATVTTDEGPILFKCLFISKSPVFSNFRIQNLHN